MGDRVRQKDWAKTPLGPISAWPQSLVNMVNMLLNARFGMFLFWGPELIQFYNDAYMPSFGQGNEKHPDALGQRAVDCWKEIWFAIGPRIHKVMTEGIAVREDNHHLPIFRNGIYEDVYWTYSYSPVYDDNGNISGVLVVELETTHEVVVDRRSGLFTNLVTSFNGIREKTALYKEFENKLRDNPEDIPFSLLYVKSKNENQLQLVAQTGEQLLGVENAPDTLAMDDVNNSPWPVAEVIRTGKPALIEGRFGESIDFPQAGVTQYVKLVYIIPVIIQTNREVFGVFIVGISPRQIFDREYKGFLRGLTSRLAATIYTLRTQRESAEFNQALGETTAQLRAQKRLYDSLVRSTPDLVYIIDADYKFRFANAALLEMWGKTLEESLGKRLIEVGYEPWHAEMHEREIDRVIATKKPIRGEVPFPHATLGTRFYDYIFAPMFGENGEVIGIAGTTRDITRIKKLEQQKDYFIATASHELKTPLTSLKAYTQVLQMQFKSRSEDASAEMMAKMDAQINKLTKLINDLLDITKMETGKLQLNNQDFAIDELIQEIAEGVKRTAPGHSIELDLTPGVFVSGDRDRIGQVVTNYLTNAIKYSPGSNLVKVKSFLRDGNIVVRVRDFGMGISEEDMKHVFERFFRVEDTNQHTFPGLGLGLFISAEIIARHGGKVWLESGEEGSTFYFSLPSLPTDS